MPTITNMNFATRMRALEQEFVAAAAVDRDVYLPNFTPKGPVDAVLIGMEPSLGRWGRPSERAVEKIGAGLRNFMWSPEDFILHYATRQSLCSADETYHITDVSKGAMTGDRAQVERHPRYARWAALLEQELQLVAKPSGHIIAIGREVAEFLERNAIGREVKTIMHYSPLAGAARNAAVIDREAEYGAFAEKLTMQDIVDAAVEVMRENAVPAPMADETIARLRKATLSESRKKLAFVYSTAFTAFRAARPPDVGPIRKEPQ